MVHFTGERTLFTDTVFEMSLEVLRNIKKVCEEKSIFCFGCFLLSEEKDPEYDQ